MREDFGARLLYYVNQKLFTGLTLEKLSREFYISQSQINRIFRKYTGTTVGQYIGAKRILTAPIKIECKEVKAPDWQKNRWYDTLKGAPDRSLHSVIVNS